jgi:glycosyltransferase involved in cell wall biosynthesis
MGVVIHASLVIYGSLEVVSGGYLYDRKLVEHLRRQGDQVEIIALPWRSYAACLGDNFSPGLLRRLRQGRFDVLLQDELNHPSLFWLNERLRGTISYPLVSIVHHLRSSEQRPTWQNRLYRRVERRYLHSVDGFIFNSQTTRQAVAQAGIDLAAIPAVVANPAGDQFAADIEDSEIVARAQQPGPLRLLFLGNLIERKGLHTLLEAIARLPAGACTLSAAGSLEADPAYVRRIRRQVGRDRLAERVQLCGTQVAEALAALLRSHHVLAVPSSYEGYGIAYLEGMSYGLPAIGTTAGAAGEIITHGQDGFLVPPEDAGALAACLAELAGDRQRLAAMGLAARRRFRAQPTWEETGEVIRGFLEGEVMGNR